MQAEPPKRRHAPAGFTRLELFTLLTLLCLLAVVIRPAWGNSGPSRRLVCMENLRRLSAAWLLYADDNGGKFVGNYHGGFVPTPGSRERPWASGWLDWTSAGDNTNTVYLTNPRYAALVPYLGGDSTVFKCPADDYLSSAQVARGWSERVRSYALNCALGEGNAMTGPLNSAIRIVIRNSDFGNLPPERAFVFLDEHPDSVNDPLFFVPNSPVNLVDVPGALHAGAGWFTFADGHLELRRWQSPQLTRPVSYRFVNNTPVPVGNPDAGWLLDHTPRR